MTAFIWLLTAAGALALGYLRAPLALWTAAAVALLVASTLAAPLAPGVAAFTWVLFFAVAVPLNMPALRRRLISDRVLAVFRRVLPRMSQTEREALEAGTVWWDGELFSGSPDWNRLLALPKPRLTAEEQAFLDGPVDDLCRMLDDWQITHELNDLPENVWRFIKENGFFGMIIPKHYGGLGFSALAHSAVVMKIASRSITAAVTVMVPNSLGPAELLLHYGREKQRAYYLPRLARGEEVPCFALTGPEAGSDASAMPDKGIVCRAEFEGKQDVLGIRLTWQKRYITLGPVATVLGLAFKLYDPDHLLGDKEELGITCALIPTDTPGIDIGRRHYPLNIAFQNGPNSGSDVFIPMDWVIGGRARVGQGWRMLMECLAAGRSISLPALSTGAGKLVSRATGAYARVRKQFKQPIGRFEGVEEALARIAATTYMMDAVRTVTTGALDVGEKPSVISAIAKYNLTEHMRRVVNDAMDIHGGSGICMGPHNYLGRVYQAIPISITVEGANILTRTLIIFGQGAIRCHPYLLREMQAAADKDRTRASQAFDRALFGHMGFVISNAVRALVLGLTRGRIVPVPVDATGPVRRYYQHITRMSAAFALAADGAMLVLGGELKRRERLSGRLADIFSRLYMVSATLKHFEDQDRPAQDLPLLQWVCEDALHHIQESLDDLLRNFPVRPLAWLLRLLIFPTGTHYRLPSDALGHRVAGIVLKPSSARDRLTAGIHVSDDCDDAVGRIEAALPKVIAAEAIEKKLRQAIKSGALKDGAQETLLKEAHILGIIAQDELKTLRDAAAARQAAIKVDDFPPTAQKASGRRGRKKPAPHLSVTAVHGKT